MNELRRTACQGVISYEETRLAVALTEYVEKAFGTAKFTTVIGRSTVVPEAQDERKTIFETAPTHPITEQYRDLAREVEERVAAIEGKTLQALLPAPEAFENLDLMIEEAANG